MLLIIDNQLKKVKSLERLNEGSYGKCFNYDNNLVLKIKEISEYSIKTNVVTMRNCKVNEDFSFGIVDVDFF